MENTISDKSRRNIIIAIITILVLATLLVWYEKKSGKGLFSFGNSANRSAEYVEMANGELRLFREAQSKNDKDSMEQHITNAIESARQAEAISPNDPRIIEYLGKLYIEASNISSNSLEYAGAYYTRLKELEPDNATVDNNLGYILYIQAEKEKDVVKKEQMCKDSVSFYGEAIAKEPEIATAYYGKALAHEKLAQTNEAISALRQAVILDKANLQYAYDLGRVLYNRAMENAESTAGKPLDLDNEDIKEAELIFTQILQTAPDHANAHYSLVILYDKLGEREKAQTELNSLLEIITDEEQANSIKEQFKDIYE